MHDIWCFQRCLREYIDVWPLDNISLHLSLHFLILHVCVWGVCWLLSQYELLLCACFSPFR